MDKSMTVQMFALSEEQACLKLRYFLSKYGYKVGHYVKAFQDPDNPFIFNLHIFPCFAISGHRANGHSRRRLDKIIRRSGYERLGLFYQG